MRSTLSNLLTTVLTFGSLLAIPVVAIFGLPDFAKISEWTEREDDGAFVPIDDGRSDSSATLAAGGSQLGDAPAWNADAPQSGPPETAQFRVAAVDSQTHIPESEYPRQRQFHNAASSPRPVTPVGWQPDQSRSAVPRRSPSMRTVAGELPPSPASRTEAFEMAADIPTRANRSGQGMASRSDSLESQGVSMRAVGTAAPRSTTQQLTWRAAISRLNELGIRQYRLQPGSQPSVFHFSCYFTPEDNPRIYHRFESEASDPLQAVADVLSQVERWRSRS